MTTQDVIDQPPEVEAPATPYSVALTALQIKLFADVQKREAELRRFVEAESARLRGLLAVILDAHEVPVGSFWKIVPITPDDVRLEWSEPRGVEGEVTTFTPRLGRTKQRQALKDARRKVRSR